MNRLLSRREKDGHSHRRQKSQDKSSHQSEKDKDKKVKIPCVSFLISFTHTVIEVCLPPVCFLTVRGIFKPQPKSAAFDSTFYVLSNSNYTY